jgi:hypothetical protein
MTEALQLWKKIAGKGEGVPDDQKSSSLGGYPCNIFLFVCLTSSQGRDVMATLLMNLQFQLSNHCFFTFFFIFNV